MALYSNPSAQYLSPITTCPYGKYVIFYLLDRSHHQAIITTIWPDTINGKTTYILQDNHSQFIGAMYQSLLDPTDAEYHFISRNINDRHVPAQHKPLLMHNPGPTIGFGANCRTNPNYTFANYPSTTYIGFIPTYTTNQHSPTHFNSPPATGFQCLAKKMLLTHPFLEKVTVASPNYLNYYSTQSYDMKP